MSVKSGPLLITGVAGFIGSHAARLGRKRGYDVHGVDIAPARSLERLDIHLHTMQPGTDQFDELVSAVRPRMCIHAAGRASVRDSVIDPAPDYMSGPALTFMLLNSLRRHAADCRVLFLSSAAVYGNPKQLPISEKGALAPISPYGFHKHQAEILCREFSGVYRMHTAAARIFSAYGEGLQRQVLWDICRKVLSGGSLQLMGTGQETRDFLHVRDIVAGLFLILESAPMAGEAYNIASGEAVTVEQLVNIVVGELKTDLLPEFDGVVPSGDPLHWCADISKIRTLGFSPSVTIDGGARAYASWARRKIAGQC